MLLTISNVLLKQWIKEYVSGTNLYKSNGDRGLKEKIDVRCYKWQYTDYTKATINIQRHVQCGWIH